MFRLAAYSAAFEYSLHPKRTGSQRLLSYLILDCKTTGHAAAAHWRTFAHITAFIALLKIPGSIRIARRMRELEPDAFKESARRDGPTVIVIAFCRATRAAIAPHRASCTCDQNREEIVFQGIAKLRHFQFIIIFQTVCFAVGIHDGAVFAVSSVPKP